MSAMGAIGDMEDLGAMSVMEGFLYEVAQDLYETYGADVGSLKMLLPSRRARLFFADALSRVAQRPVWEPEWVSMDGVMERIAGVEVGERVALIAELYKVYVEHHPSQSFDKFYFWGEIMLGDFDMVDKYLIDADMLFRNVADIKELESDLSYLSEQERRIVAFWSSIGAEEDLSEHKRNFLKVWQSLAPIYHTYKERLAQRGFAYAGMVHRIAVERIRGGEWSVEESHRYVVAGFNALSECEKVLLGELKRGGQCRFYWDWDNYYIESSKQEAGLFIGDNKRLFPSACEISHDNFSKQHDITVVASSSSALQCKYVARVLDEIVAAGGVIDKNTAIVLTDESLLLPLLYALPKYVGEVNVTMGYPLRQSLAYSFVERLLELQNHARKGGFYHIDVAGIISHPYLDGAVDIKVRQRIERSIRSERLISVPTEILRDEESPTLQHIFRRVEGWVAISRYIVDVVGELMRSEGDMERVEFLSYISDQVSTLHNSVERCGIELSTSTYLSLLRRHLQALRVPFEGEPLEGLQVMGILETRTLDFENVIILSMDDDNFPGNSLMQPSYIPYNLRAAYELPTPEHHDGVYAYYFYRLIQRARRVWLMYCSVADDKSTGEQSRYITQLDYESPFTLRRVDVGVDVNLFDGDVIEVKKDAFVAQQLSRFRGAAGDDTLVKLSPTAIARYISCPLKFYFYSLARISNHDDMSEQVDDPMFGNILHSAMQTLYEPLIGTENLAQALSKITNEDVEEAVRQAIRSNYLRSERDDVEFSGDLLLVQQVVERYIKGAVLRYDIAHSSFKILGVEDEVELYVRLSSGDYVRLWGVCDRIDRLPNGSKRVVDYKTGVEHLEFDGVESIFTGNGAQRQSNIIQTLLYSYMLYKQGEQCGELRDITPSLFYVRKMNNDDYSPLLIECASEGEGSRSKTRTELESYAPLHELFEQNIQSVIDEIFDLSTPFSQCKSKEEDNKCNCNYCDYSKICRRDDKE